MAGKDIRQKVQIDTGDSVAEIRKVEDAATAVDEAIEAVKKQDLVIDTSEIDRDFEATARKLEELEAATRALDGQKMELRAELDARGFDSGVQRIQDARPGRRIGEQFVQDIGGSFGGTAFSQFSADLVAGFETLGETLGDSMGGRMVNRLSGVLIPALGVAGAVGGVFGGLVPLITKAFSDSAEEITKKAKELFAGIKEAAGDTGPVLRKELAEAFEEMSGTQRKAFTDAGLGLDDVVRLVRGEAVPEFDRLRRAADEVGKVTGPGGNMFAPDFIQRARSILGISKEQAERLRDQAAQFEIVTGLIEDQSSALSRAIELWKDYEQFTRPTIGTTVNRTLAATSAAVGMLPSVGTMIVNPPPGYRGEDITAAQGNFWQTNGTSTWRGQP